MKVSKLIEKLGEFNPNADISLTCSEDIHISYICKNHQNDELFTKETTPQVFIEIDEECPFCVHSYMDNDERFCSFYEKLCCDVEECFQYEES